jgi:hypothetical protein
MDRNEYPLDTHRLGVLLGVPKMISILVEHLLQILHLSSAEINTISKRTETSFHLTHITEEYRWVCPK